MKSAVYQEIMGLAKEHNSITLEHPFPYTTAKVGSGYVWYYIHTITPDYITCQSKEGLIKTEPTFVLSHLTEGRLVRLLNEIKQSL